MRYIIKWCFIGWLCGHFAPNLLVALCLVALCAYVFDADVVLKEKEGKACVKE